MSAVKDLTKGSPMKLILGFMLPMLLGLLFQQFYNMVDTIVVGQFLGVNALAGVGSTGSVNFLVLGFCMGVCAGFAIPVAQKFGEKDFDGLRKFAGNTIWHRLRRSNDNSDLPALRKYPPLDEYSRHGF